VVKLTTVQMIRQPLQHKICKIGMICSATPVLTEDLCVVQEQNFFNNMLYMRNVHLTKGQALTDKSIFSSERMLRKDYYHKGSVEEKISGRGSQGA
jgi:hypothetical protein